VTSDPAAAPVPPNAEQAAGGHRVRYAELFDAEVRRHNERLADLALRGTVLWTGFGPRRRDYLCFIFRADTFSGTPITATRRGFGASSCPTVSR
jgi:hypothetical protein